MTKIETRIFESKKSLTSFAFRCLSSELGLENLADVSDVDLVAEDVADAAVVSRQ